MSETLFIDLILVNIFYYLDKESLSCAKKVHSVWFNVCQRYEEYLNESTWAYYYRLLKTCADSNINTKFDEHNALQTSFCNKTGLIIKVHFDSCFYLMMSSYYNKKVERIFKVSTSWSFARIFITNIRIIQLPNYLSVDQKRHFLLLIEFMAGNQLYQKTCLIDFTIPFRIKPVHSFYQNWKQALIHYDYFEKSYSDFLLQINDYEWNFSDTPNGLLCGVIRWSSLILKNVVSSVNDLILNKQYKKENVDFLCNRYLMIWESNKIELFDTWSNDCCAPIIKIAHDDNFIYYCQSLEISPHLIITLWGKRKTVGETNGTKFIYYIFDTNRKVFVKHPSIFISSNIIYRSLVAEQKNNITRIVHFSDIFANPKKHFIDFDVDKLQLTVIQ